MNIGLALIFKGLVFFFSFLKFLLDPLSLTPCRAPLFLSLKVFASNQRTTKTKGLDIFSFIKLSFLSFFLFVPILSQIFHSLLSGWALFLLCTFTKAKNFLLVFEKFFYYRVAKIFIHLWIFFYQRLFLFDLEF